MYDLDDNIISVKGKEKDRRCEVEVRFREGGCLVWVRPRPTMGNEKQKRGLGTLIGSAKYFYGGGGVV